MVAKYSSRYPTGRLTVWETLENILHGRELVAIDVDIREDTVLVEGQTAQVDTVLIIYQLVPSSIDSTLINLSFCKVSIKHWLCVPSTSRQQLMSRVMRKPFCVCGNKSADQLRSNCKLISAFVCTTSIVQSFYFSNPKF